MKFSIMTRDEGKESLCEYTGRNSDVLIKLTDNSGEKETAWMGKDALVRALKTISALEDPSVPQMVAPAPQVQNNSINIYDTPPPPQPLPSNVRNDQSQLALAESFAGELQSRMVKATDGKGRINGSEIHAFLRTWRGRFPEPIKYAYPIVKKLMPQIDQEFFLEMVT